MCIRDRGVFGGLGIIAGAKQAVADGLSFDDYCELIAKIIISGQTVAQVRQLLINVAIDTYFDTEEGLET